MSDQPDKYAIAKGDIIDWCQQHVANGGEKFHVAFCDPPYCLDFMGVGQRDSPHRIYMAKHPQKVSELAGILGMEKWEAAAILWYRDVVSATVSVCYPNALIAMFCGARTADLLAAGIRAAGCTVFDQIPMLYGSGMPHGQNYSLAADARLAPLELSDADKAAALHNTDAPTPGTMPTKSALLREAITDEGRNLAGYFSQLAPGYETLILARAPWDGSYIDAMLQFGTGGINVDGVRTVVAKKDEWKRKASSKPMTNGDVFTFGHETVEGGSHPRGRYPKNIMAVHRSATFWCSECGKEQGTDTIACPCSSDAFWIAVPGCVSCGPVLVKGQKQSTRKPKDPSKLKTGKHVYGAMKAVEVVTGFGDDQGMEHIDHWECVDHWVCSCGHVTPYLLPHPGQSILCRICGGTWQHVRCASRELDAQTMSAKELIAMSPLALVIRHMTEDTDYAGAAARKFFYTAKTTTLQRNAGADTMDAETGLAFTRQYVQGNSGLGAEERFGETPTYNPHPTLKNIHVCARYATMIAPPPSVEARLLIPFSGVGSEMVAALTTGLYAFVQGIELDADDRYPDSYIPIAHSRIKEWLRHARNPNGDMNSNAREQFGKREARRKKVRGGQTQMEL